MRGLKLLLGGIALASATLVPASAEASVKVLGDGFGSLCYEYARNGHASEEGVDTCTRALTEQSLSPSDIAATLVNRGILHMYARQHKRALADYEQALKVAPALAEAYINKGIVLVNLGRDSEAIAALSHALELNPERPELAYHARGVAHEMLGKMRSAYRDYRKAAELKPEWQEPQAQLRRFSVVPKSGS